ncbi:Lsr2 family protein [Streptomyces sp. NPDC090080]|uniref:histone-like nucleoid-structuring protein Lsr2 n=1 Tax=Streptomyces sp. NPDC090080 TaxID=3365939 RepID=UPI00381977CD
MAQKEVTSLIDDLDGKSVATEKVVFSLDGRTHEIDLTKKHAAKLRKDLAPYVQSARKVSAARDKGQRKAATPPADDSGVVRQRAKKNGYEVSNRGRISAEVRATYQQAKTA